MSAYGAGGLAAYSSYFGGNNTDFASGISMQAGHLLHIVGNTFSPDLPVVGAPVGYDSLHGSSQDGFIVRSPILTNRIAASAGGWAMLALLGALLLYLGTMLQRQSRALIVNS